MNTARTAGKIVSLYEYYRESMMRPDEFIIFLWLFQKSRQENYKEFTASYSLVETETKVKRMRQEAIFGKFSAMGWLETSKMTDEKGVTNRSFLVHFSSLQNAMDKLFIPYKDGVLKELSELFGNLAKTL